MPNVEEYPNMIADLSALVGDSETPEVTEIKSVRVKPTDTL